MENPLYGCDHPASLTLIETLLWDGSALPRLKHHMARLAQSAQRLGWTCDLTEAWCAADKNWGAQPLRLRLAVQKDGAFTLTHSPFPQDRAVWRLGVAHTRVSSQDPWLRVKSSNRHLYDHARQSLPQDLDELIFVNERGEVCEGSITSIFFDRGQGLRTPPLSCGLLDGVLRREVAAQEDILFVHELGRVRLWVGNALRGMRPAHWTGRVLYIGPIQP